MRFTASCSRQGKKRRRGPGLIFTHGGPIRQMLLGWHYMQYYSNAYAMNQYLASKGYTVLSVNYRLGIMYGRAFREPPNSVWRGASEYQDVVAGAKFLQTLDSVDPQRIGLWGGSYGGFLTAMGLARNSDIFKAGVDFHGVHDWAIFLPMWVAEVDAKTSRLRPTSKKRASSPSNHRQSQASRTGAPLSCWSTATTIATCRSSKPPIWSKNCAPKTSRSRN